RRQRLSWTTCFAAATWTTETSGERRKLSTADDCAATGWLRKAAAYVWSESCSTAASAADERLGSSPGLIKAQRRLDDGARIGEHFNRLVPGYGIQAARLCEHALAPFGRLRQQIERPCQRAGRGFLTAEDEGHHIVPHLPVAHALTGFGIFGG